jgi:hypothetical protein
MAALLNKNTLIFGSQGVKIGNKRDGISNVDSKLQTIVVIFIPMRIREGSLNTQESHLCTSHLCLKSRGAP